MIRKIENGLVEIAVSVGPLLAPIPTAYMVALAVLDHFGWHWSIAVIAALTVEFLGLQATGIAMAFFEYNTNRLKSEPPAPFRLALALVIGYFVIVTGLTLALDVWPNVASYAKPIFPALVLAGFSGRALRYEHARRLALNAGSKAERKAERAARKADRLNGQVNNSRLGERSESERVNGQVNATRSGGQVVNGQVNASRSDAMNGLLTFWADNPRGSYSAAAAQVGRSKAWVAGAAAELESAGKIHRNGNGIEVK